jgi:hypothetical protein
VPEALDTILSNPSSRQRVQFSAGARKSDGDSTANPEIFERQIFGAD